MPARTDGLIQTVLPAVNKLSLCILVQATAKCSFLTSNYDQWPQITSRNLFYGNKDVWYKHPVSRNRRSRLLVKRFLRANKGELATSNLYKSEKWKSTNQRKILQLSWHPVVQNSLKEYGHFKYVHACIYTYMQNMQSQAVMFIKQIQQTWYNFSDLTEPRKRACFILK